MTTDPRLVSCAILIGTCGRLILQLRDDVPNIIYPGLVSLFGGHREPGEDAHTCIQRELEEEIGIKLPLDALEPFLKFSVSWERRGERRLEMAIYVAVGIPTDALQAFEGQLMLVPFAELPSLFPRMTPSTCHALSHFLHARALPPKAQQVRRPQVASPDDTGSAQQ